MTGTSMAAPHVSGSVALLSGARRQSAPEAPVPEILRALACAGPMITRRTLPAPRIDVDAATRASGADRGRAGGAD